MRPRYANIQKDLPKGHFHKVAQPSNVTFNNSRGENENSEHHQTIVFAVRLLRAESVRTEEGLSSVLVSLGQQTVSVGQEESTRSSWNQVHKA